jgi:hypothetical protein
MSTYKKELPCDLTNEGIAKLAIELAQHTIALHGMEREYKDIQNGWRDAMKEKKGVIKEKAEKANNGIEMRFVDCVDRIDEKNWQIKTFRLDTGEQHGLPRAMSKEEIAAHKQTDLPLDEAKPAKKKKTASKKKAADA